MDLAIPMRCKGPVIHGFKRGSKELGIPTANLDIDLLSPEIQSAETGVYYGWAAVGTDPAVHKFVMSVGWSVLRDFILLFHFFAVDRLLYGRLTLAIHPLTFIVVVVVVAVVVVVVVVVCRLDHGSAAKLLGVLSVHRFP